MSKEERLWWMMLVHSEAVYQHVPQEDILLWIRINGMIRCHVRDTFKLNLDTIGDKARDKYEELVEEYRAKEKAEAERDEKVDKLLAELGFSRNKNK